MHILEILQKLRDDLKTWITNNLNALNDKIDEKTAFSGDYNDLTNAPDISEDESGNMVITDESGNIIFKADADGIHTTAVSINGETAATEKYVDDAIAEIPTPDVSGQIETHNTSETAHEDIRQAINTAKEELSESIVAESDEWKVVDGVGNIIFSVDAEGAHTTALTLNGETVEDIVNDKFASLVDSAPETLDTLNELAEALGDDPNFATTVSTEIGKKVDKVEGKGLSTNDFTNEYKEKLDGLENITFEETDPTVPAWAKEATKPTYTADEVGALPDTTPLFSGDYNDLDNAPNITEDDSNNLVITDPEGNIIFRSDGNGFETTTLTANTVVVDGVDVSEAINGLATEVYVDTELENKADKSSVYTKDEVNSKLSSVYKYKGTIENYSNLPTQNEIGDVWNLKNAYNKTIYGKLVNITSTSFDDFFEGYSYSCGLQEASEIENDIIFYDRGGDNYDVYNINGEHVGSGEYIIGNFMIDVDVTTPGQYYFVFRACTHLNTELITSIKINAGDNLSWTGTEWDVLAGTIDTSSFAMKATTLAGYGITNAYTKEETDLKLTTVYKYKGTVHSCEDLPSNPSIGDVWNVASKCQIITNTYPAVTSSVMEAVGDDGHTTSINFENPIDIVDHNVKLYNKNGEFIITVLVSDAWNISIPDNPLINSSNHPEGTTVYLEVLGSDADQYNTTPITTLRINAGDNVAWTGDVWDVLAGTVDLSNYATKDEVSNLINLREATFDEIDAALNDMATSYAAMKTLTEEIISEQEALIGGEE